LKHLYLDFLLGSTHVFYYAANKNFYRTVLQNSDSSKGQIINTTLPPAANVYFISMWRFR